MTIDKQDVRMKISVIIPMYNESRIIADTAKKLFAYMSENFEDYEIIFSDDGSSDGSADIVNNLGLCGVSAVRYDKNRGKGCAVRQGMLAATGDIRIFTDADLAYGVNVIGDAVNMMQNDADADMLIGSRNISKNGYDGYTLLRKIMSKTYIRLLCVMGGFRLSDSQCGFKAFRKDSAIAVFSECKVDGFAFDFEVILRALSHNKKIIEMPVKIINHRESSVRPMSDSVKMLGDLLRIKKLIKKESRESNI